VGICFRLWVSYPGSCVKCECIVLWHSCNLFVCTVHVCMYCTLCCRYLVMLYRAELGSAADNTSRWWTVWQSDVGGGRVCEFTASTDGRHDDTLPHKNWRLSGTSANLLSVCCQVCIFTHSRWTFSVFTYSLHLLVVVEDLCLYSPSGTAYQLFTTVS